MQENKNDLGLSLSGGGYSAAAFHLGTLKKLHELAILSKVDVLSTISGGSITGAAWCCFNGSFEEFEKTVKKLLATKNVIKYILTSRIFIFLFLFILIILSASAYLMFTPWAILGLLAIVVLCFIVIKFQYKLFPVSKIIENAYNKYFYANRTLRDLKPRPIIAIGSSNMETGRPFTFSQLKMSDSAYKIKFKHANFPIARAVMASSCVPFAFSPVAIGREYFEDPNDYDSISPQLVDGGVFDNQGIQKITQHTSSYSCNKIITSDAGGRFYKRIKYDNVIALLARTADFFMNRIKNVQMIQNLYTNPDGTKRPIAYLSLGWGIEKLISGFVENMVKGNISIDVVNAHGFPQEWVDKPADFMQQINDFLTSKIGYSSVLPRNLTPDELNSAIHTTTNLTSLSEKSVELLMRHAENLTELQVKLYLPFY